MGTMNYKYTVYTDSDDRFEFEAYSGGLTTTEVAFELGLHPDMIIQIDVEEI